MILIYKFIIYFIYINKIWYFFEQILKFDIEFFGGLVCANKFLTVLNWFSDGFQISSMRNYVRYVLI